MAYFNWIKILNHFFLIDSLHTAYTCLLISLINRFHSVLPMTRTSRRVMTERALITGFAAVVIETDDDVTQVTYLQK